jgi:hypothetical protein
MFLKVDLILSVFTLIVKLLEHSASKEADKALRLEQQAEKLRTKAMNTAWSSTRAKEVSNNINKLIASDRELPSWQQP